MKFYCIADEHTVRGFRLAGVGGKTVATAEETAAAVDKAAADPDCAILILTEAVAAPVRARLDAIRMERDRPLVVEIPGAEGPLAGRKPLRQLVQEAIGIRLGQREGD